MLDYDELLSEQDKTVRYVYPLNTEKFPHSHFITVSVGEATSLEALDDTSSTVRARAARDLARRRSEMAVPRLVARLNDPSVEARAAMVLALGSIGDRSVWSELVPLLSDSSRDVRWQAAHALGELEA
jgi:HEAT repeat protein